MREDEAKVWGLASKPGGVSTAVTGFAAGRAEPIFRPGGPVPLSRDLEGIAYGAFPLQGSGGAPHGELHWILGDGRLTVEGRARFRACVERAVHAWLRFGGVGGRTRRGFGAVEAMPPVANFSVPATPEGHKKWLVTLGAGRGALGWAHETALLRLKGFRQRRNPGFGRSHWPEPEAIRALVHTRSTKHPAWVAPVPMAAPGTFPRGHFGLPIIFEFKHPTGFTPDPAKTQLHLVGHTRLASRVHLRPVRVGAQFAPECLVLPADPLATTGFELRGAATYAVPAGANPIPAFLAAFVAP